MSTHQLKFLQSRKTSAEKALQFLRENLKENAESLERREQELLRLAQDQDSVYQSLRHKLYELESQIGVERQNIRELEKEIENLKSADRPITISEHAILRYLERVKGLDLEAIKEEILPRNVAMQIDTLGDGCYPASTHRVQIRERVAVTVLDLEKKPQKYRKRRKASPKKDRVRRKHHLEKMYLDDLDDLE